MKKFLVSVICFSVSWCLDAQLVQNSVVTGTHGTIWFYQYKPPNYNNTDLFPLIIELHGVGEAGNSQATLSRVTTQGIPLKITQGNELLFTFNGKTEGFVLLAPQSPDVSWPEYYVDEMIAYGIAHLRVDPNRIFLTGYSAGGGGVWRYATSTAAVNNPIKLAGIVPAASSPNGTDFCNIASQRIAVWAFHGGDDVEIPQQTDHQRAVAVNACGPAIPAVDTIIQNESHGIYQSVVYDVTNAHHYPNVFQWMLKVNRNIDDANDRAPVPVIAGAPVINLTTPVKVKDYPVLNALGSTDDDIIMDYKWTQTAGYHLLIGDANNPKNMFPVATVSDPNFHIGLQPGTFTFQLQVKDYLTSKVNNFGSHTRFAYQTVNISLPASGHSAPAVDAGTSRSISTSSDRQIGNAMAYTCTGCGIQQYGPWTLVSKPAGAPNPKILDYNTGTVPYTTGNVGATFSNLVTNGNYVFQFAVKNAAGDVGTDQLTITRINALLPVNYAYFNGQNAGNKNVLNWATTSEINSERFDIMRSTDGVNFTIAGTVASKGGSVLTTYTFDDNNPPIGLAYYRLSQVDKDGQASLSQTISVNNLTTRLYIEKYPNPAHDNLTVTVLGTINGSIQMIIADMQGRTVLQQQWQKNQPRFQKVINVGSLQKGVYQMIIIAGQEKQVSSFVKY